MPAVGSRYTTVQVAKWQIHSRLAVRLLWLRNVAQGRTGRTSFQQRQSIPRMYFVADYSRERQFVRQICESRSLSLQARGTRVIHRGIVCSRIPKGFCDYRVDVINRRLVMFYFVTRVNAAALIIDQVRTVIRKKRVFCHMCNIYHLCTASIFLDTSICFL